MLRFSAVPVGAAAAPVAAGPVVLHSHSLSTGLQALTPSPSSVPLLSLARNDAIIIIIIKYFMRFLSELTQRAVGQEVN